MKNKISNRMGWAPKNRPGYLNWEHIAKLFPEYREHIFRIRKNIPALVMLRNRLVK